MTTSSRGWLEIDVRLVGVSATALFGTVRSTAKRVEIPLALEQTGNWKNATIGETIQLRIPMELAEQAGIVSAGPTRIVPGAGGMISG